MITPKKMKSFRIRIHVNNQVNSRFIVFLMVFFIICSSCSGGEGDPSAKEVNHPKEKNIPHYTHDHISVDTTRLFNELDVKSEELLLLYRYLENPNKTTVARLDVKIGSPFSAFNVVSVDNERIVILDDSEDRLLEYSLNDDQVVTLAQFGRGPGDIHLPTEIVEHNNFIYILREDMQISRFNCQSIPCEFDKFISLEVNPASLAPTTDDSLAVLGTHPISQSAGLDMEERSDYNKPVKIINQVGRELATFGSMYDTEGHWLLLQPFVSNGKIRYSSTNHLYILTFDRFPYIYIYDAHTLELEDTYKISNFLLGKQSYWPDERRLRTPENDYSIIRNISIVENNLLWIEVETRTNYTIADRKVEWDKEFQYYLVNLRNGAAYYMGNYKSEGNSYGKNIYLTQENLILYNEEEGALFRVIKQNK